MSNTHTYVITERNFNAELLQKILSAEVLQNVKIVPAGGYSSATSLARSMLYTPGKYVIIAVDAGSNNEVDVLERYYFLRDYMRMGASEKRFTIHLFKPEIEHVFFEDKKVLETIVGKKVSDLELELAALQPRLGLSKLSGMSLYEMSNGVLLNRLSNKIIQQLRQTEDIKKLTEHILEANKMSSVQ